uniref:uncharacterized protein LOC120343311 n=1 Tax=Styela clava TaxID=7725 RepID=UPI00193AB2A6|nr:uncharacterized protein LOC120343311 [Styela clava]
MSVTIQSQASSNCPRNEVIHLHPQHKSVFVHGYGGSSESAEHQAHILSSYIYDESLNIDPKIAVIPNGAQRFNASCAKATTHLLDYIKKIARGEQSSKSNGDECVELLVYCHSNGAKPVQKALTPEKLTELCKKENIPEMEIDNLMRRIRKKIVVISFGGVTYIPGNYAKIVMNFCSTSDYFSQFCHFMEVGKQPKDDEANPKIYVRDPAMPEREREVSAGIWEYFPTVSTVSGAAKDLASKSCCESENHPHYLGSILKNKKMICYIREVLGLKAVEHLN